MQQIETHKTLHNDANRVYSIQKMILINHCENAIGNNTKKKGKIDI